MVFCNGAKALGGDRFELFFGAADSTVGSATVQATAGEIKLDGGQTGEFERAATSSAGRSPPGPPPEPAGARIRLDQAKPGLRFDGLGAIIDASSRLMYDYPEPQRSEIMDYLFKPHFGAALSIAKVEVGGDAQQTDGTTASYRHDQDEPPNFNRSHIWWAMASAKSRRPDVTFYGLGWGFPGFLESFYSNATAEYLAGWVAGAQAAHGFNVSVLGLWNERTPCRRLGPALTPGPWNCDVIFALRDALDRLGLQHTRIAGIDNSGLKSFALEAVVETKAPIGIVATHGPPVLSPTVVDHFREQDLPFWRSEGEETYTSSGVLGHRLVRDFVEYGAQATIEWPIVQGFYPVLPWGEHDMFFGAHSPWSGHYGVPSSVWTFAHLGQFADPGWRYLGEGGNGFLSGGGSFCSLVPEDGSQLTLLIETLAPPNCSASPDTAARSGRSLEEADGPSSNCPTEAQSATFVLPQSARAVAEGQRQVLEVWQSQLGSNDPAGYMIKREAGATVAADGSFTLAIPLNVLITVTTAVGLATKGAHGPPPPQAPFPLPYSIDYSTLPMHRQGPYLNDQQGSFEIGSSAAAIRGAASGEGQAKGLLQTVKRPPINCKIVKLSRFVYCPSR